MSTTTATTAADKLLALEREDKRLYRVMDRTIKRRGTIKEELSRLRLAMTAADWDVYGALVQANGKR